MATHRMSIMGAQAAPDATGRAFFETYDIKATNDIFKHLVLVLSDPSASQAHGLYGAFTVPKNYVGTPKIIVVWTTTATSGNVKFDFDYRAVGGDDAESLDQTTFQESLTVTDAAPSAANERMEASMTITAANLAIDDLLEFYFTREDGSSTDTLAAAVTVHDLIFEWADA
jgi:hypothetical protein